MSENLRLSVDGGKYTYISYTNGTREVLRHGKTWLTADGMTNLPGGNCWSSMAYELEEARKEIAKLEEALRMVFLSKTYVQSVEYAGKALNWVIPKEGSL